MKTARAPEPPGFEDSHRRDTGYWLLAATVIVLLPHLELGVVDHRVAQLVPLHRLAQVVPLLLVGELGRVDADDHQLAGVLVL